MSEERFSLHHLLHDEVTQAVLRADRLHMDRFKATLRAAAERLPASGRSPSADSERGATGFHPVRRAMTQNPLCCGA